MKIIAGHGYSSSKQNLDPLCAFLSSHGFEIYSLDFPGHKLGASGGTLEAAGDCKDAMDAAVRRAREDGDEPMYLLGHSMGALTAIVTAGDDAKVAGIVAIATGFGRSAALAGMAKAGVVDFRSAYVEGLPLPALMEELEPLVAAALPKLGGRPALYVAAERDMMVTRHSVQELFERAPEPKSFASVDSDHTRAGENSRSAILRWLDALHPRRS
ncbi:MAG: alpha/beta fold hydrolase [Candidatus Eremiobacteraeota bacterium]|nr:alpha/beta fold hydrolase [Candidatus Eremiobacteraeota bacterium]